MFVDYGQEIIWKEIKRYKNQKQNVLTSYDRLIRLHF